MSSRITHYRKQLLTLAEHLKSRLDENISLARRGVGTQAHLEAAGQDRSVAFAVEGDVYTVALVEGRRRQGKGHVNSVEQGERLINRWLLEKKDRDEVISQFDHIDRDRQKALALREKLAGFMEAHVADFLLEGRELGAPWVVVGEDSPRKIEVWRQTADQKRSRSEERSFLPVGMNRDDLAPIRDGDWGISLYQGLVEVTCGFASPDEVAETARKWLDGSRIRSLLDQRKWLRDDGPVELFEEGKVVAGQWAKLVEQTVDPQFPYHSFHPLVKALADHPQWSLLYPILAGPTLYLSQCTHRPYAVRGRPRFDLIPIPSRGGPRQYGDDYYKVGLAWSWLHRKQFPLGEGTSSEVIERLVRVGKPDMAPAYEGTDLDDLATVIENELDRLGRDWKAEQLHRGEEDELVIEIGEMTAYLRRNEPFPEGEELELDRDEVGRTSYHFHLYRRGVELVRGQFRDPAKWVEVLVRSVENWDHPEELEKASFELRPDLLLFNEILFLRRSWRDELEMVGSESAPDLYLRSRRRAGLSICRGRREVALIDEDRDRPGVSLREDWQVVAAGKMAWAEVACLTDLWLTDGVERDQVRERYPRLYWL